jgi:hypothetical protein
MQPSSNEIIICDYPSKILYEGFCCASKCFPLGVFFVLRFDFRLFSACASVTLIGNKDIPSTVMTIDSYNCNWYCAENYYEFCNG